MSFLKELSFTTVTRTGGNDPRLIRRQRLIDRLEEQLKLARDPNFVPVMKRRQKQLDTSNNPHVDL